jgi:hypothetical protein
MAWWEYIFWIVAITTTMVVVYYIKDWFTYTLPDKVADKVIEKMENKELLTPKEK